MSIQERPYDFWIVARVTGAATSGVRHKTLASAIYEAKTKAAAKPGRELLILHGIGSVRVPPRLVRNIGKGHKCG